MGKISQVLLPSLVVFAYMRLWMYEMERVSQDWRLVGEWSKWVEEQSWEWKLHSLLIRQRWQKKDMGTTLLWKIPSGLTASLSGFLLLMYKKGYLIGFMSLACSFSNYLAYFWPQFLFLFSFEQNIHLGVSFFVFLLRMVKVAYKIIKYN